MTHTIDVDGDKTLSAGDDGMIQLVNAEATIKLPHEDNHNFVKGDEFTIVANSTSTIKVTGEEGVTLEPLSKNTVIGKGGGVNIKYQGDNTYLMWGIVSLIIVFATMLFAYNNTIIEDEILLIKYSDE